jgi:carbon storage regulator
MLTLSRKAEEVVLIGSNIRIIVKRIDGDVVKLGIEAPRDVPIHREELIARVSAQNREAADRSKGSDSLPADLGLRWPKRP